jgi:ribosomal protein S18 acetylase RimI-like enzyme
MTRDDAKIVIEDGGSDVIDQLQPLWLCLHRHHQAVGPSLAPYVDDRTSWKMRRRYYAECLAHPGSFVRIARRGKAAVGYALVRVEATTTIWSDTWITGDRTAEVVTLVISPEERGHGTGTALLDAVEAEIERLKIGDVIIGAIPNNIRVLELYRQRGFEPTWLVMTRFAARRRHNGNE